MTRYVLPFLYIDIFLFPHEFKEMQTWYTYFKAGYMQVYLEILFPTIWRFWEAQVFLYAPRQRVVALMLFKNIRKYVRCHLGESEKPNFTVCANQW